jgi:hypothetical protein
LIELPERNLIVWQHARHHLLCPHILDAVTIQICVVLSCRGLLEISGHAQLSYQSVTRRVLLLRGYKNLSDLGQLTR